MEITEFITRLAVAFALGAVVGLERQWRLKSAGLRTNTLVSLGSAAYILLSVHIFGANNGDPSRIAAQIVTGIGFLGAGVIMKDGMNIQGLNTAATIWCSAAVGALAGMGLYYQAALVGAAIVLSHVILRPVSVQLAKIRSYRKTKSREAFYRMFIYCNNKIEHETRRYLVNHFDDSDKYLLRSIAHEPSEKHENETVITVVFSTVGKHDQHVERLIGILNLKLGVTKASWAYMSDEANYQREEEG